MPVLQIDDVILDIIRESGPLTVKQIVQIAQKKKIGVESDYINSILYGYLREVVVRERNQYNVPVWRIKTQHFEAGKGYESHLYNELLKQKIIDSSDAFLDYEVRDPRYRKTYHLDIAILKQNKKYNIEVDGFDHIRADARLSIQQQLQTKGKNTDIEIDWMDNKTSYIDFKKIDNKVITAWCNAHLPWCIKYHEELLWPYDITRNIWLIDHGWSVMRLWNPQIQRNTAECVKEIEEWITTYQLSS